MRKTKTRVTTKTGQIKASPIESEIHPSHKTPFYALGYFAIASSRHLRKSGQKTPFFSPAPMAFPRPFRFLSASAAGKLSAEKSVPAAQLSLLTSVDPYRLPAESQHVSPGNGYGKPMRVRYPFATIILLPASMILRKERPLLQPGNGRTLVTASPKLALAG